MKGKSVMLVCNAHYGINLPNEECTNANIGTWSITKRKEKKKYPKFILASFSVLGFPSITLVFSSCL